MTTTLLPREHGAYGQLSLPLVTALSVAGPSIAGLLVAVSAVAAFVAHEPASVLLGLRGARVRQELGRTATQWLAWSTSNSAMTITGRRRAWNTATLSIKTQVSFALPSYLAWETTTRALLAR